MTTIITPGNFVPTWENPRGYDPDGTPVEATWDWLESEYGPPPPDPAIIDLVRSEVASAPCRTTPPFGSRSILTLAAVATHFGVTPKTIINVFVRERGLRALRLGREWRFRAEDVTAFEQEQFVTHGRRSS